VTVHRNKFLFNNQPDALIIQIYSVIKLHVSGIFSAHHQELSTVHSALVSFVHVSDDRFQAESGWNAGVDVLERQFQHIHTSGRQQESMTIPKAAHTVL
jgi:hypothetical protein